MPPGYVQVRVEHAKLGSFVHVGCEAGGENRASRDSEYVAGVGVF